MPSGKLGGNLKAEGHNMHPLQPAHRNVVRPLRLLRTALAHRAVRLVPAVLPLLAAACSGTTSAVRTVHIPFSGLVLTVPASWQYVPAGGSGSQEIQLGFLSTSHFRPPCGTFTVQGQQEETCIRPFKVMGPRSVLISLAIEASPTYWNSVRGGRTVHLAGHLARIFEGPFSRDRSPWFCPLGTQRVITAVICLQRNECGGTELVLGNYGVISACLRGPGLPALTAQVQTVLRSMRWTFEGAKG